jgi:hypothetical protein
MRASDIQQLICFLETELFLLIRSQEIGHARKAKRSLCVQSQQDVDLSFSFMRSVTSLCEGTRSTWLFSSSLPQL